MVGVLLANTDQEIRRIAAEIAACAPEVQEGDEVELLVEVSNHPTPAMLREIASGVKAQGVEVTSLKSDADGVHLRFRVGVLPLFMIAIIAIGALVPVGVIGWRLFHWTPQELTGFLMPFFLGTLGCGIIIVRPRPVTVVVGGGLIAGGVYLALREVPKPPPALASILAFRYELAEALSFIESIDIWWSGLPGWTPLEEGKDVPADTWIFFQLRCINQTDEAAELQVMEEVTFANGDTVELASPSRTVQSGSGVWIQTPGFRSREGEHQVRLDLMHSGQLADSRRHTLNGTPGIAAVSGVPILPGAAVDLVVTVKNEDTSPHTFQVAVIFGVLSVFKVWTTEDTFPQLTYPKGSDAAAVGDFVFAAEEVKDCVFRLTVPEDVPEKTYDTWVMVFDAGERVAEKKFEDTFPIRQPRPEATVVDFDYEVVGAERKYVLPGDIVNLLVTVSNDDAVARTYLVVVLFGESAAFAVWTTEPTMPQLPYPGAQDAAAKGYFTFVAGEEKQCAMPFPVPVDVKRKDYDTWIMVFSGEHKVGERRFLDRFLLSEPLLVPDIAWIGGAIYAS